MRARTCAIAQYGVGPFAEIITEIPSAEWGAVPGDGVQEEAHNSGEHSAAANENS
jgi:hypothetical protein